MTNYILIVLLVISSISNLQLVMTYLIFGFIVKRVVFHIIH